MRSARFVSAALALYGGFLTAGTAFAQQPAAPESQAAAEALRQEIGQVRKDFDARLADLEARLAALTGGEAPGGTAAVSDSAAPAAPQTAEVPPGGGSAGGLDSALAASGNAAVGGKVFNPDIAVIGNFVGVGGRNTVRPDPALQMREAEASFQAIVDPYARADFFMAFGEEGVDLEEGYVTFPTLPGGLLMKVGKMRAAFGKVNTFHTHQLQWVDRPLVTDNLVNGEEGIDDAGISVARLIPNPWVFLEATGQVYRGDSGDVFHSTERGQLGYVGHLRAYQDLTESTNLDVGASYAYGHNPSGLVNDVGFVDDLDANRFTTGLIGTDITVRWRPLRRAIYHSFIGRSELIWSRRDQPDGRQDAFGFYVSGDYQAGRRWFVGARLDRSDRADAASVLDTGGSAILTYMPSEFSLIRGQYRRTDYGDGPTANEFLFQLQFAIGAHGAHPF